MLFTPIYIAMTFIKTWRIRSFRARLLEFLSGNTSVAFFKVPGNAAETPTLSSKLCTNPKNTYLCDLLDYTNATRICSMKPAQCIELTNWISCAGGLPLGCSDPSPITDLDVDVLFECEMEPHTESSYQDIITLDSIGQPVAWKAGTRLAIVLKTNIESLSLVGFNFVGGEFVIDHKLPVIRIQTVQLSGEPNKATDPSMRSLRSEVQQSLKNSSGEFQWPAHALILRKLSKVVDIKSDLYKNTTVEMNGTEDLLFDPGAIARRDVTLADVGGNSTMYLSDYETAKLEMAIITKEKFAGPTEGVQDSKVSPKKTLEADESKLVSSSKKPNLKLDLKKSTSQISSSILNISSQIKSVTTHKRIVSTTGQKKSHPQAEAGTGCGEDCKKDTSEKGNSSQPSTSKSAKGSRPLVNTKSPNILIYSDSVVARDNLEASLRKVLDCDRYTLYSVTREALEAGAWRGRAALVAIAGCVGRGAPLLLAHLLDGGRLLALCSDLLHTVLPYYKTAEVRENEVVQFTFDKWKSVKMKHHIFCYQASPAKKQFSTESERQPSKYTGHPGHELDIQVLASEETWRTPSLLQATDVTNQGVAIFSQIHLEADPSDYLGEEGVKSNEARLDILHKILGENLGLHVRDPREEATVEYTHGYFLGNHVEKLAMVKGYTTTEPRLLRLQDLTLQWCLRHQAPIKPPSENFLPIYVYECPENFSTVEYFTNLSSLSLGCLVVYADTMTTTMRVTGTEPLAHGLGAIARQQTRGRGRAGNSWLTPVGQAAMSLQVWQKRSKTLPLVQLAVALAVVRAIRYIPGYDELDIRIKWPNDIYYGRDVKIGGVLTTATCNDEDAILNIGIGVNISNSTPTTCVNDIITEYNIKRGKELPPLTIENFLGRYCTHLERILFFLEDDMGSESFIEQYSQYWLHDNEKIRVTSIEDASESEGIIVGVDESASLIVRTPRGEVRVAPDGNTFDMLSGLVAPKL